MNLKADQVNNVAKGLYLPQHFSLSYLRWHNHLDPHINKKPWTEGEEQIIFEAHKKYGNKWAEIAKTLPGRLSIRYKFYNN